MNAKYGFADRAKNVLTPDYELKIATKALRKGEKALYDMIYDMLGFN